MVTLALARGEYPTSAASFPPAWPAPKDKDGTIRVKVSTIAVSDRMNLLLLVLGIRLAGTDGRVAAPGILAQGKRQLDQFRTERSTIASAIGHSDREPSYDPFPDWTLTAGKPSLTLAP